MKSLPCPAIDIPQYVSQLVLERQNGGNAAFFTEIADEWRERCEEYHTHRGDARLILQWDKATERKTTFVNLYSHPKGWVQEAPIKTLRGHDLVFCPICGEAGTPHTLDHYLPKEHFPHLAVLPQNLVPACDICQGRKKSEYVGPDGKLFAHIYYDEFLNGQSVRLLLAPPYNAPKPTLTYHPDLHEDFRPLVKRHLVGIGLEARYHRFFRTEYQRVLKLAKRCREKGMPVVSFFEVTLDGAADRSVSSWEHITLEGILADPDVMEYLQNGELPPLR